MAQPTTPPGAAPTPPPGRVDSRYKWIALSNITLGTLMVFINQSIVLIALPGHLPRHPASTP